MLENGIQSQKGTLTVQQTKKVENFKKTSFKTILGDNYIDYPAALEMMALKELSVRRQKQCFAFAKNSLKYSVDQALFPENQEHAQNVRTQE